MNKTKTKKYVNHDGWPELRKRLEKELLLFESFSFEPDLISSTPLVSAFYSLKALSPETQPAIRSFVCNDAYRIIFQHYPIIKLKVSEQVFESWLLTHSIEDLKNLISYKE